MVAGCIKDAYPIFAKHIYTMVSWFNVYFFAIIQSGILCEGLLLLPVCEYEGEEEVSSSYSNL